MTHTRRAYLVACGAAVSGGAVAGCLADLGPGDGSNSDGDGVNLLLNWQPSGLHAPYYGAATQGFYEEEGFDDVTIESGQGSDFSATQAGLGNTEFAISSSDQVLNVAGEDLSPLAVGIVMQRNPTVVFAPEDRFDDDPDPSDLEDVTLGSGPGMVRQMTEAYLEHHDVRDAVDYVDSGFDTVQQLLEGEIDVAAGVFSDVVDAEHQGSEMAALPVQEAIPSYGHLVATETGFADENPETVRAFLRATARGAVWATRNPEAAIDALVDAEPELEEVRENQRDKWEVMRNEYALSDAVREHGWGWSEPDPWRQTYETLADGDDFEGEVDPDEAWDNDYLDTESEYVGEYASLVEDGGTESATDD